MRNKCVARLTFADLYCTVSTHVHVHACLHLRPHTDRHTHRGYITIDQVQPTLYWSVVVGPTTSQPFLPPLKQFQPPLTEMLHFDCVLAAA